MAGPEILTSQGWLAITTPGMPGVVLSGANTMWRTLMIGSLLGLLSGCSGLPSGQSSDYPDYSAEGKASYYGARPHGKRTASGERFDQNQPTAAHRPLPFGSRARVTNQTRRA